MRSADSLLVGAEGWLVRACPRKEGRDLLPDAMEFIVLALKCADGVAGWGWSYTAGVGGRAVLSILEELTAHVVGWDSEGAEDSLDQLRSWLHPLGFGGVSSLARAPLDIAVWDARAKRRELPLYQFWGGTAERVPAYGSGVDLGLDLRELESEVADWVERGFQAVKVKVGRTLADDLSRMRAVRRIIGPEMELMLDANQRWDAAEAIERSRALEEICPRWLEEPVSGQDAVATGAVRAATSVPVAAGETLFSLHEVRDFLDRNSVDVLQLDVPRIGGYSGWRDAASLAGVREIQVTPHYAAELAVQLSAAMGGTLVVECLEGRSLADMGLVRDGLTIAEGEIAVPDRLGVGIEFDREAIACRAATHFTIGEWPN